jgi:flagellar motor switch protein FliM
MTKPRNKLTIEKIRQLQASVTIPPAQPAEQTEAIQYDWTQPHYFNKEQLEKLNDSAKTMASAIAAKFGQFLRNTFKVQPSQISQHYAQKSISQIFENAQKDYYLILKGEKDVSCGLVTVPKETAVSWLRLLLGESEAKQDADQQLSQLEKFLLCDVICHLADAIVNSTRQLNLTATKTLLYENFSLDVGGCEELCKISFDIKQKDVEQSSQVHLMLPCSKFAPILGAASHKKTLTPEQVKNALLEYAKQLPVCVTARFTSTELKFEQILTLQKGDILVLDKKVTEPLELIVEGKTRYLGQFAKSGGALAVKITHANTKDK